MKMTSMNTIPDDIIKVIFSFLDFKSNTALSSTALRYYHLSKYYISFIPKCKMAVEIARKYETVGYLNLSRTDVVLRTAYCVGTRN